MTDSCKVFSLVLYSFLEKNLLLLAILLYYLLARNIPRRLNVHLAKIFKQPEFDDATKLSADLATKSSTEIKSQFKIRR